MTIDSAFNNVTIQLTATGILSPLTENQAAFSMSNQFNTLLAQMTFSYTLGDGVHTLSYLYRGQPQFTGNSTIDGNGFPIFGSMLGFPTFRVNVSEGVLTFFSECDYDLTLVTNLSGATFRISETPLLCTIAEARNEGPINGLVLTDINGVLLTDYQVASLIEICSSRLIAMLRNRVVVCTRIQEEMGYWQRSFFLRRSTPGIWFDGVWTQRPYAFGLFGIFLGGSGSSEWNYKRRTGELQYMLSQNCFSSYEPSSFGNAIKISYVGGYYKIPIAIQAGLYRLMAVTLENNQGIASEKAGTWEIKYKDTPLIDQLREELSEYIVYE